MKKEPDHEASPPSAVPSVSFDWNATGWEGHAAAQLARVAAASPAERLAWLEAALEMAVTTGAIRARRPSSTTGPRGE